MRLKLPRVSTFLVVGFFAAARRERFVFGRFPVERSESGRGGRSRRVLYFRRVFLSLGRRRTRPSGGAPKISVKSAKSPSAATGKGAFFGRFRRGGALPKSRFSVIMSELASVSRPSDGETGRRRFVFGARSSKKPVLAQNPLRYFEVIRC